MSAAAREKEKGVALVTVLMIVAAMSAVGVAISSAVLASTNRAKALDASAQARWFAAGAEAFGEVLVSNLMSTSEGRLFAGMPGLEKPVAFPVEGGTITLRGYDASNCLNLNALAAVPQEEDRAGTAGLVSDYVRLIESAHVDRANPEGAAAALVDWMDANQSPELGGAEDSYYRNEVPPFRTSGQPLEDTSELRVIRHHTPDLVAALQPLVCAMPDTVPQVFNLNTLKEDQAPLLSVAMSGALSTGQARDVLFQRPPGGWADVEAFLAVPAIAKITPDLRRTQMLSVTASHIGVDAAIEYRGVRRSVRILYKVGADGSVEAIRRERRG